MKAGLNKTYETKMTKLPWSKPLALLGKVTELEKQIAFIDCQNYSCLQDITISPFRRSHPGKVGRF